MTTHICDKCGEEVKKLYPVKSYEICDPCFKELNDINSAIWTYHSEARDKEIAMRLIEWIGKPERKKWWSALTNEWPFLWRYIAVFVVAHIVFLIFGIVVDWSNLSGLYYAAGFVLGISLKKKK